MRRIAIGLLAGLSLSAVAATETYNFEPNHTYARFGYSHLGYSTQISRFNKVRGTLSFDKAAGTGSVDVTIDTKSVDTGSDLFNQHIQGEDYLDTAKFGTATYKSSKVHFKDGVPTSVDGELTLKGVTHPVTLTVSHFYCMPHPMLKKDACGADATAQVKRTDFNMGKNAPYVGDEVTISIAVEAVKE
ncbi:MAG: polyisoprenoid-binding protein [Pseudomonadota bacterium]|nr:polyisoprenoid-binding protein [Pseudomonadota bacterium]